jgi:hypothetical protein
VLPVGKTDQLHYATLALDVELAVSPQLKFFQLPFYLGIRAENGQGSPILLGPSLQEGEHPEAATIKSVQFAEIQHDSFGFLVGLDGITKLKGSFALNQPPSALHDDRLINLEYLRREHRTLPSMAECLPSSSLQANDQSLAACFVSDAVVVFAVG